jgi:uridine phosphorylase
MNTSQTELILNAKGNVYHLDLNEEWIAPTCITVGDPERVSQVSKHFDRIDMIRSHREFVSHIGQLGDQQLMVISTGIGSDNVDIVINEIDALLNIDLKTKIIRGKTRSIRFIRIGTSGTYHPDIPIDSWIINPLAIGTDNLMRYYPNQAISLDPIWLNSLEPDMRSFLSHAYVGKADPDLIRVFGPGMTEGITLTTPGFFGAQARSLRLESGITGHMVHQLHKLNYGGIPFTNFEMETAGIYALAHPLGHQAISVNAILANRLTGKFSSKPEKAIEALIINVLEKVALL